MGDRSTLFTWHKGDHQFSKLANHVQSMVNNRGGHGLVN